MIDLGRDTSGRRRQKWITVRGTRRNAERELARIIHEIETGAFVEPSRMGVGEYLERWLSDHAKSRVAPKTFERYAQLIRTHIVPNLGSYRLSQLKRLHSQGFYTTALDHGRKDRRGGLSAQTVVHIHRVLRTALKRAVHWQLLARNPADAVEPPRPAKTEMQAFTEEETAKLFHVAERSTLSVPILIAVTTGVRRGELLALRWTDIDLNRAELTVRRSLQQTRDGLTFKEPKTARGRRTVTLTSLAVEALRAHQLNQKMERLRLGPAYEEHGLVFPKANGQPWPPDSFTSAFAALIRRSDVPRIRFHDLRHSHASQLLRQGVHPKIVSERLGHSTVAITLDTYSHVLPGLQRDVALKLNGALREAIEREKSKS